MEEESRKAEPRSSFRPAVVSVIAEAEVNGKQDLWTALSNSKAIFIIIIILLYLFCGTIFYKYYDQMSWANAYYFSVNAGFRIGYSTPTSDIDNFSKLFSAFFKLTGVCILAFFYTVLLRSSYFQRADARLNRLLTSLLVTVVLLVFGTLWSYLVVGWSFINGVYFVFSTCFWWGSYSVPTDSDDWILIMTANLALVGGLAVFVFFAFLAAHMEIYIENYLIKKASQQTITSSELGIIEKLLIKERKRRDQAAQSDPVKTVHEEKEDDEQEDIDNDCEDALLLESETEMLLSKEVVEHLLLIRILALDDVSLVYFRVRLWLFGAFALFLIFGMLFYKVYDGSKYWCLALNYSVSSFYRLGYSNSDVDSFSQIMSTLIMLVGCFLFNLLNVCITREFGLKARDIRYFHTLLDGILCLTFCSLTIAMFLDAYSWTGVQSFVFAIDVMMGYGDNVPSNKSIWSYWLLDLYTIVIIPLFVAYVSHVEVELDIGDALGYMNRALSVYFDQHDLRLVQVHDDFVDKRYAVMNRGGAAATTGTTTETAKGAAAGEKGSSAGPLMSRSNSVSSNMSYLEQKEEENLVLSRNEFGTYELHVLLVLRLKDIERDKMRQMVLGVNKSYNAALSEGLEVLHCYNDEDVHIIDLPNEGHGFLQGRRSGSFSEHTRRSGSPDRQRRRSSRPRIDSDVESQHSAR